MTKSVDRLFERYDHLGFLNPFYVWDHQRISVATSFSGILSLLTRPPVIDSVALVEIMNRGYCFGERTLIQGIQKTPWMGKPTEAGTEWEFAELPPHGDRMAGPEEIADGLFSLLCAELAAFCQHRATVGLLLSGGMDSRVVACALDRLRRTHQLSSVIVGLTWGVEGSRDVTYARQITDMLGWEFKHIPLGPENLLENVSITAERGCQYSPVHLHAMPRIRDTPGLDGVIAASYGDSVGRAEFSGTHLTRLRPLDRHLYNRYKMLRKAVFQEGVSGVEKDVREGHQRFPRSTSCQQYEVDQELHYMQRCLNSCMAVIAEKIPFFQAFSSPQVFGYMWSFSPRVRTDHVYKSLLERHGKGLLTIPWARTGAPYPLKQERSDAYTPEFHAYGHWMRRDLREFIAKKLFSESIAKLGILNTRSLKSLYWMSQLNRGRRSTQVERLLLWVASLAEFVERYGVQGGGRHYSWFDDALDGWILSPCHSLGFSGRQAAFGAKKRLRDWIRG